MNLIEVKSGEKVIAKIKKLTEKQVVKLKGNRKFQFDWSKESKNEVYALLKKDNNEILGLVSIIYVPEELRVHLNLIESSIANQGKHKLIDGIPGCLIGYVCEISFKQGYDGFVSLLSKTRLVDYYHDKFGFVHMGNYMVVFLELSQAIITKYLKNG